MGILAAASLAAKISYLNGGGSCNNQIYRYKVHAIRNKDYVLEPLCCKKWQKNPCQEIGLGNMGRLKVLNDTNLVLNGHK